MNISLIGPFSENFCAQASQVLNGHPHLLHVALDAGVVEDREGAGGQRQIDRLQHHFEVKKGMTRRGRGGGTGTCHT